MQFDFGRNWDRFSRKALTPQRVDAARNELQTLMHGIDMQGRTFLDIGFGQGLSLLVAQESGARAVGCDINPLCARVLSDNRRFFPALANQSESPVVVGSILEEKTLTALRRLSSRSDGRFDIVHSWGVLHHTGDMWKAVDHAVSLVAPGGYLILALYNAHWSSPAWRIIKRAYCAMPPMVQSVMAWMFVPVIFAAKLAVTGRNPLRQQRGMDFYYNVIDWVGGYPYEYATVDEVTSYLMDRECQSVRVVLSEVPTGCNEFVFVKVRDARSGTCS